MDANIKVLFDATPVLQFVQGEDRQINLTLQDENSNLPINLTGAQFGMNLPLQGGGSVKRSTLGPIVLSSQVVVPGGSVPKGYITLPDHGLVTGDPITLVLISGSLPAPLTVLTSYLVQTIDVNSFYITDLSGNVISLTSQGSGSFNLVNANDVQVVSGDLGQVTLNLRGLVSQVCNAALAQDFQVQYTLSGKTRILVLQNLLDVLNQPVM